LRPQPTPTLIPYTTLFRSEEPGDGDLEPLGEEVTRVASRIRPDGRIGGRRRERQEAESNGDDPESEHVKAVGHEQDAAALFPGEDRKSTRLNSSHVSISYA